MAFEDYLEIFQHTCISIDFKNDYTSKSLTYDGNTTMQESEQVKCYFQLDETI